MIGTIVTLSVCAILFALSRAWWRSFLNPVSLGIVIWMPALVMLNWPPFFLLPVYIHLNQPVSPLLYLALALAFVSFWGGAAMVRALIRANTPRVAIATQRLCPEIDPVRAYLLFGIGFAVFVYSYLNSGLLGLANLDEQQVAESRLALHMGFLSFVVLFMDISAIALLDRFMRRGGWLNAVLMPVAIACQGATLQKSRFVFLIIATLIVAALHPQRTYELVWRRVSTRIATVAIVCALFVALFVMNQVRGIAVIQMTAASSPILEQMYIYSGASAIMNMSVTLQGYIPSDPAALGLYLGRPILWHFIDRDLLFASRYLEGVNAGTYLIYGWADFRWLGFVVTPFLTGAIIMLFLREAARGTSYGLMLGAIAAQATVFSVNTDVIFDPTTPIIIGISIIGHFFMRQRPTMAASIQAIANRGAPVANVGWKRTWRG